MRGAMYGDRWWAFVKSVMDVRFRMEVILMPLLYEIWNTRLVLTMLEIMLIALIF
jgi:hypothetical protein